MKLRLLCALVCLSGLAFAQDQIPSATTDSAAQAVLTSMRAATGWDPANLPTSLAILGRTTFVSIEGTSGADFTTLATATGKYSSTSTTASRTARMVSGDGGSAIKTGDTIRHLPPHVTMMRGAVVAPFFGILGKFDRPNVSAKLIGMEKLADTDVYRIELSYTVTDPANTTEAIWSRVGPVTVWIDATSYLPAQLEYRQYATNNLSAYTVMRRQYADYRKLGSVLFPYRQTEMEETEQLRVIQEVISAQLNPELSSTDFTLPKGAR